MTHDLHIRRASDEDMQGAWLCELQGPPVILDRAAELQAIRRAKGGDEMAQEKLIRSQLRWITKLAREVKRPPSMGIEEIISVGAYELIRCLANYDESRGFRLNTFSERSIRGAMWRYVHANDGAIRIPDYVHKRERMRSRLAARNFSEPFHYKRGAFIRSTLGDYLAETIAAKEDETGRSASNARRIFAGLFDKAELSERERRAFALVFLSGGQDTYSNAGLKMGLSRGMTSVYVARAWRKMQASIGVEATPVPYQVQPRQTIRRKASGIAS